MGESAGVSEERHNSSELRQQDGRQAPRKETPAAERQPAKRSLRLPVAMGLALAVVAAFPWWLHARHFEDTDDAQIDGDITAVSPRVPGTVTAVHVVDNQQVKEGDLLVELDPNDLDVAVAQARAAVAQAEAAFQAENPNVAITETSNRASVASAQDDVDNARAEMMAAQHALDQAEAQNRFAQLQLERGRQLVASNTISQNDFDQRVSAADVARANVAAAQQRIAQKKAKLD